MRWNNLHHLPVVDDNGTLVGLITWQHPKQYWDEVNDSGTVTSAPEIMVKEVTIVEITTSIKQVIELMKHQETGCLPVLQHTQLVGIITSKDLVTLDND